MANQDQRTQKQDMQRRPQPEQQEQARDKSAKDQHDRDMPANGQKQTRQPDQNAGSRH